MFSFAAVAVSLSLLGLSQAQVTPTGPSPGQNFVEGQGCLINWTPDTTGTWKTTYVELMTGDNFNMVHLTTVTSFDGTDTTKTSFTYPCPKVSPHSPIYFYQFTSTGTNSPQWTGRFSISDATGAVTPPLNATQPNGAAIPWGTGALADPSTAKPPPPTSPEFSGSASAPAGSSSTGSSSGTGTASASSTSSSTPTQSQTQSTTPSGTPTPTPTHPTPSGPATPENGTETGPATNPNAGALSVAPLGAALVAAVLALFAGL